MSNTSTPRTLELVTSDSVSLEAEVAVPDSPRAAAVLTHPHPQHGGSMQSIVTGELFRALPDRGVAVLRFNFRGVGASGGSYGGGVDERLDIDAAVDTLAAQVDGIPLGIAGWSFGADVALRVDDRRLAGWFLVAPPLALVPVDEMVVAADPRPKLLAVPEHDNFRPPAAARQMVEGWVNTDLEVVPGADHVLIGRTDRIVDLAERFLTGLD
jgi:alpha/beta superfamily hydrolase